MEVRVDEEVRLLARKAGEGDYEAAVALESRLKPLESREALETEKRKRIAAALESQNRARALIRFTNTMNLVANVIEAIRSDPVVSTEKSLRDKSFEEIDYFLTQLRSDLYEAAKITCWACQGTTKFVDAAFGRRAGENCSNCSGTGLVKGR